MRARPRGEETTSERDSGAESRSGAAGLTAVRGREGREGTVARRSVRIEDADPEAFLASALPGHRGFWQRGSRWIAHAGCAAEVVVGTASSDRYDTVRRFADRVLPNATGDDPPARLFGGFAFASGRPAARFVLPALELEAGPGGFVLRATVRRDRDTPRRGLRERLGGLLAAGREWARSDPPASILPDAAGLRLLTDLEGWDRGVERILDRIADGTVEKAVLARAVEVEFASPPDPVAVLARLRARNPRAWPFLLELERGVGVVGAAPELLMAARGGRLKTMAVAGTTTRGEAPAEDERLARRLAGSRKDLVEHGIGVRELGDRLSGLAVNVQVESEPRVLRLADVQHLRTDVRADLLPGVRVLDLVEALHPTAAVCGHPRRAARRLLTGLEPVPRGWYAGPVGWLDANGEGIFVPALRSAVLRGRGARLHAGAGIVTGSRPEAEWHETRIKLRTVLDALGADGPW